MQSASASLASLAIHRLAAQNVSVSLHILKVNCIFVQSRLGMRQYQHLSNLNTTADTVPEKTILDTDTIFL